MANIFMYDEFSSLTNQASVTLSPEKNPKKLNFNANCLNNLQKPQRMSQSIKIVDIPYLIIIKQ